MDNFDIKRFARTVRWMYRINVKNVLSFAAGLSFGYLFTFIGWLWPLLKSGSAAQEAAVRYTSSLGTCSFIYVLVIVFSGIWIFSDMNIKGKCITLKMLPATDFEKFLARFLAMTLGTAVAGFVAFCIADVLRIVFCLAVGIDYVGLGLAEFITNIARAGWLIPWLAEEGSLVSIVVGVLLCVWAQSLYMLGSVLLRRYQHVVVTLVLVLAVFGLTWLASRLGAEGLTPLAGGQYAMLAYIFAAVLAVATVADWWLSYKVFSRMQVINNKWINL